MTKAWKCLGRGAGCQPWPTLRYANTHLIVSHILSLFISLSLSFSQNCTHKLTWGHSIPRTRLEQTGLGLSVPQTLKIHYGDRTKSAPQKKNFKVSLVDQLILALSFLTLKNAVTLIVYSIGPNHIRKITHVFGVIIYIKESHI